MRANQVHLEFQNLGRLDTDIAQLAHTGGDGVSQLVVLDQSVDNLARGVDLLPGIARGQDRAPVVDDFVEIGKGKIVAVEPYRVHEFECWRCGAKAFMYLSGSERR